MALINDQSNVSISQAKKKSIITQILILEQKNLNSQQYTLAEMVKKIQQIIEDEVNAHKFN